MVKTIKRRIVRIGFVKTLLDSPVNLEAFKKKPTPRFIAGLVVIGLSYLMAWPLIMVLGVLAAYFKSPLLFAIGSPVAYGISHLIFMLGLFIAGKDTVAYLNVFLKWSLATALRKLLGSSPEELS